MSAPSPASLTMDDAASLLRTLPAHGIPQAVCGRARALGAERVGLYVVDLDGSRLLLLSGDDRMAARIDVSVGVGPELSVDVLPVVAGHVRAAVGGGEVAFLRVRDRAIGVLVGAGTAPAALQALADEAGAALELASGYTDVVHHARRRRRVDPAAEIQQELLPPRIAASRAASLAGGILPGYDVGGDFFDHADNADGLWLAVGDAMGKGTTAAAAASTVVGAMRAARRNGSSLEATARVMDETLLDLTDGESFVTGILARLDDRELSWINFGHPAPLLARRDGTVDELATARPELPLGVRTARRSFTVQHRTLVTAETLLMYSDGVTERRGPAGERFGLAPLRRLLADASARTAAQVTRAIQDAVVDFSRQPLRDDATLLVASVH